MDIKQITETLSRIFEKDKKHIIFWYDGEKEFEDILTSLELDGVSILRLDEWGALELKIKLESEDAQGKYILYAPFHEPPPEKDWLYDIRLYSHTFHCDKASIILKELGLANQSMRPFLKERGDFFKSQDRLNRLKKWVSPDDKENDLDIKMLAVITRADQPEPFSILMKLFSSFCSDGIFHGEEQGKIWADIEKLGLRPAFWRILHQTFGYLNERSPGIHDFLFRIFVTDLSASLKTDLPTSLSHFVIENASQSINCSVFLSQWRTNTGYFRDYNLISKEIGTKLKIDELFLNLDLESLLEVMIFEVAEQRIISYLRDQIGTDPDKDYEFLTEVISRRQDGYWVTTILDDDSTVNLYHTVYSALEAAIHLFELRNEYQAGFSYKTAQEMFGEYTEKLFYFDQYYRKYHELSDKTESAGWDILKPLNEKVEACYSGWYMEQMPLKWGEFLEQTDTTGLISKWRIPSVTNQYDFFKEYVHPTINQSARNRLFVIISDAFRYEAAEELTQRINGKYRLSAELEPMLGILPGYTGLGMAALLPHKTLSFKDVTSSEILVDGNPSGSFEQRSAILKAHDGIAIKAEDLIAMSKDSGREFVKPHRLIYIFHDKIDAIGDKAVSESNTFEAVRSAIDEIYSLVRFIINSLNGTKVLVTADHGFIYQEKAPKPIDKSNLEYNSKNAVKTHKRFILGRDLGSPGNVFAGNTKITSGFDTEMEFLIPKGTNRYNFIGGARFFHGGVMLQEVVIPVITVTEMKGKHLEKSEVSEVGVSLLGNYKKLVTNRPIYRLIQTDPISDRMKPRTLKISLREENRLISNEETITFDSSSPSMDERQKSVKFSLMAGNYDNKREYYLVMRNIDDTEYDRIPIIIDIAFANDF